jgi:hypothetical protein
LQAGVDPVGVGVDVADRAAMAAGETPGPADALALERAVPAGPVGTIRPSTTAARARTSTRLIATCMDVRAKRASVDLSDIELRSLVERPLRSSYTSEERGVPIETRSIERVVRGDLAR